ncbi:hypothetical protein ACEWY4_006815 [Coilia grayii]|uniref:Microtubule-associated protein 4 n=1 Tax=Coilia grayii TaxID=363190 RepID=A0ABD1KFF1_9TELE
MDLSLCDAVLDGKTQVSSESLLKRDFVAELEAESFDDKVAETVGKTEYRPLLDRMDGKKEEPSFMSGMHMGGLRPDPQGEKGPCPTGPPNYSADFLSGPVSMMGMPDQWASQQIGSKMKDNSMESFMGSPQTGVGMSINTGIGISPVQAAKPAGMAEPPKTSPLFGSEPPKSTQMSGKANDSNPFNVQDNSVEVWGNPWAGEDTFGTALPHASSITTGTAHHADQMEHSPSEPSAPQGSQSQDPTSGEEKGSEGGNSKQQRRKKKKRRHREEVYDLLESLGSPESEEAPAEGSPQGYSSPTSVDEESWESEIRGRGGGGDGGRIRARKNKSRKKLPEEWAAPQELGMDPPPDSSSLTATGFHTADQDSTTKPGALAAPAPGTHAGDSASKKEKDQSSFGLFGTGAFSGNEDKHTVPMQTLPGSSASKEAPLEGLASTVPPSKESPAYAPPESPPCPLLPSKPPPSQLDQDTSPTHSPTSHSVMFLDSVLQTFSDSSSPSQQTPVTCPSSQMTQVLSSALTASPVSSAPPQPVPADTSVPSPPSGPSCPQVSATELGAVVPDLSHPSLPAAPSPAVSSSLNPAAPPFIPSFSERQDPLPAEPPLLEGW